MKIDEVQKSPASGPLQGTVGQEGLKYFLVTQTATGRCIRGGGVHRNFKKRDISFEYPDISVFHRKCSITS
jgi:hypothetical protein